MKNKFILLVLSTLVSTSVFFNYEASGQSPVNRDTVILAAHEIISETTYCGLVTIDSLGQP